MGVFDTVVSDAPGSGLGSTNRSAGTRQDTFVIRAKLEGNSIGIWDKKTGGGLDTTSTSYYAGNMADAQVLGGRKQPGNVTLQRLYDRIVDHDNINDLYNAAGFGVMSISQQPLDQSGNPYGGLITWQGILKKVQEPDVDSESQNAALFEIEVQIVGSPSLH